MRLDIKRDLNFEDYFLSEYYTSLKNQFIPVYSIDRFLSLIDFDEHGIKQLNDLPLRIIRYEYEVPIRINEYLNLIRNTASNNFEIINDYTYITSEIMYVNAFRSKDVLNIIENFIDTTFQMYPEIKTLINEFPNSKRLFLQHYFVEMVNGRDIQSFQLHTPGYSRRTYDIRSEYDHIKELCFSTFKPESLSISKLNELKSKIMQ